MTIYSPDIPTLNNSVLVTYADDTLRLSGYNKLSESIHNTQTSLRQNNELVPQMKTRHKYIEDTGQIFF